MNPQQPHDQGRTANGPESFTGPPTSAPAEPQWTVHQPGHTAWPAGDAGHAPEPQWGTHSAAPGAPTFSTRHGAAPSRPLIPAALAAFGVLLTGLAMIWPMITYNYGQASAPVIETFLQGSQRHSFEGNEPVTVTSVGGILMFVVFMLAALTTVVLAYFGRLSNAAGAVGSALLAGALLTTVIPAMVVPSAPSQSASMSLGAGCWLGLVGGLVTLAAAILFLWHNRPTPTA